MVQGSVMQGRVMGVDFGQARIGIAISDELRVVARPLCVIRWRGKELPLDDLSELLRRHEIGEILVGLPRNMDGSEGPSAERARHFAEAFASACPVTVRLMDERLSSREAYRMMQPDAESSRSSKPRRASAELDAHAAAVILQRYLDGEPSLPLDSGSVADGRPMNPIKAADR
jgi:putative holliday junction resolvase